MINNLQAPVQAAVLQAISVMCGSGGALLTSLLIKMVSLTIRWRVFHLCSLSSSISASGVSHFMLRAYWIDGGGVLSYKACDQINHFNCI